MIPEGLHAEIVAALGRVRASLEEIIVATPHELRFPQLRRQAWGEAP